MYLIKNTNMKKILIGVLLIFSLTSCLKQREHKLPQYITELRSVNKYDTLLTIKGETNIYFFDAKTKEYKFYCNSKDLTKTELIASISTFLLILIILLFLILVFL